MRKIIFRGIECYVSDTRIKKEDMIEGFNYYGIRHSDEDWGIPITIEDFVVVNHWGTLASKTDLVTHFSNDIERWGENDSRWCIDLTISDEYEDDTESSIFMWAAGEDNSSDIDEDEDAINLE